MSAMSTARSEAASILQFLGYSIKPELYSRLFQEFYKEMCLRFFQQNLENKSLFPPVFASGVWIYRLFPSEAPSIVIVVTPLTAIMKDQIRKSNPK